MASRRPGSVLDLLCKLPSAQPQGVVFNYSNGESCLIGALVVAATGRPLADYCAEKIWRPAGMEADGYWQLESDDGLELGGLGVSARLRDFGPLRPAYVGGWRSVSGRRVLPPGWRDLADSPTARPLASVGSCPVHRRDTAITGGRCRPCPAASTTVPSRREAPLASSSSSIRPSRWSLQSRARGVNLRTAMPRSKSSR